MDLLTLRATLGLDTSEFVEGLNGAAGLAAKGFGKVLSKVMPYVTDFGKNVMDTGLKTDKALGKVFSVVNAGSDAYGQYQRDLIKTAVLQEAAASTFDAAEVAAAAYYEGLAGYDAQEVADGLHGIVVAAEASGEPLQRVSDILTDTVTAFGDTAKEQSHYADVMAATATNSNTTIGQMGNALKYIGPIAGSLGYDIEEVSLTLGLMANNAVKGSQAGTTLRNIFTRIATNAGKTTKDLGALDIVSRKLGVDFYDSEGKVRPWINVLDEMRDSWKGMDEAARNDVATAFGTFSGSAESAGEILKAFTEDVQAMNEAAAAANNAKSSEAYLAVLKRLEALDPGQYKPILDMLGIEYTDDVMDLAEALDQARIKMGLMSDEERIYFAKQVGSMRGMSGFLALMNATGDSYDELKDSIYGANGAADDMRDIMLDNLPGDIERFNAQLDVLKYAIFDDVKGPLRDVTQYATGALERITKAINEKGILGGLDQLGLEIKGMARYLEPIMRSLGEAITPMVQTLVQNLIPTITEAAAEIGGAFISGIGDYMRNNGNILEKASGLLFSGVGDTAQLIGGLFNLFTPNVPAIEVPVGVAVTPEVIQQAIDDANASGTNEIIIDGLSMPVHEWENVLSDMQDEVASSVSSGVSSGTQQADATMYTFVTKGGQQITSTYSSAISEGARQGGEWTGAHLLNGIESLKDKVSTAVSTAIADGGNTGGDSASESVRKKIARVAPSIGTTLSNNISSAGNTGGASMANNINTKVSNKGSTIKDTLATSLGKAGSSAGSDIVSRIQSALSIANFVISVFGTLFGGGNGQHFAKAQNAGRILRGATVFGVSGNGEPLIGGENGPEAVIGTNSLRRMVYDAAGAAAQGVSGSVTINVYQQPGQDSRQLAEAVQKQFVQWEKQRRAVYR